MSRHERSLVPLSRVSTTDTVRMAARDCTRTEVTCSICHREYAGTYPAVYAHARMFTLYNTRRYCTSEIDLWRSDLRETTLICIFYFLVTAIW